jgi:glycosyltransferase involved in cell wall biosynthesis
MRPHVAPPTPAPAEPGPSPTFSIVIPAYQAAAFVAGAVSSALEQTYPPAEVIVADDGSTDDLERALAPFREGIRLVRGPHLGPPAARNLGFRAASGDFVVNLDADDLYEPERLEALAELAVARPDLDILATDAWIEVGGERVRRAYSGGWDFFPADQRLRILERNFILSMAAVRRSRYLEIGGFDEAIRWADDWDFWLRLLLAGSAAGCVDEPLARYIVREGSISTNRVRVARDFVRALEKARENPGLRGDERPALERSIRVRRRELAVLEGQEALLAGDRDARRRSLELAFGAGFSLATRAKALLSAVAPGVARHLLRLRAERAWIGAGGTRVSRD